MSKADRSHIFRGDFFGDLTKIRTPKTEKMKQILLTTDFSENARHAARYAIHLFGTENVSYTLLNSYLEPGSANVVVSLTEFMKEESQKGLNREEEELHEKYGDKLQLTVVSHYGDLISVVKYLDTENHYDYIVMGTKGSSRFEAFLMGSTTISAVKTIQSPLLLIPTEATVTKPERIAFAADYDHLKDGDHLKALVALVKEQGAQLDIFHVGKEVQANYDEALEGFELHNLLQDVNHVFHSELNEDATEGIAQFVTRERIDILALVARNRSFWDRLFHKSVSQELSLKIECPMLVLHD
jgi:nucleotide-binding universal stress UspA family protein